MSSNYLTHFAFSTKCAKASQTKEFSGRFAEYFSKVSMVFGVFYSDMQLLYYMFSYCVTLFHSCLKFSFLNT